MRHIFTILAASILLAGCQMSGSFRNSSAVEYLYPNTRRQEVSQEIPHLTLPLRVGVAFTPGGFGQLTGLTEVEKQALLRKVSENFHALDFVDAIEIIPSSYLRPGGSFENLDQLKRMFDIDVIALVSYDQTRFTDEGFASVAYWTILGAYVVKGEKNTTHTMLDTVVYDIDSRKLLFRAPGVSSVKSSATLVNLQEQQREDAMKGFDLASADLVKNLTTQLDIFREKAKASPSEVQIAKREGYKGSASASLLMLLASLMAGMALRARRTT